MENHRPSSSEGPSPVTLAPKLSVLALLGSVLFGAYGLGFWLLRDRGPNPGQHAEAAAAIRAAFRPGDRIFLLPSYATEAREYLGDLAPVAVKEPLAEDLEPYERVWIYALFDAQRQQAAAFDAAGHRRVQSQRFGGGIVVDLYELTGPRMEVVWNALTALPTATVVHERSEGRREPCARWHAGAGAGRWVCPRDSSWFYVGAEYHRMGERVRRCLWAHPPREGRLVVRFFDVPWTGSLVGRAGHTLTASKRARAPIHLDVTVADEAEQRFVFELEDTWRPFRLRTPLIGTGTVSFAISSPDNGANHFCFEADTRRPGRSGPS